MDSYNNVKFIDENGNMDLTPCTIRQTKVLIEEGLIPNGAYQRIGGMTIYPQKVMSGQSYSLGVPILAPYSRAIHHFEASWKSEEENQKRARLQKFLNENLMQDYEL